MPVWPKVTVQNPAIDGYAFPCSTGRGSKAEVLGEKLLQLAVDGSDNLPAVRLALRADLSVWGQSNLLATVPAGRVPFSDVNGAVTSNAGLAFNSGTGTLTAGNLTLGNGAENSPSLNLGDPTTGFWRASAQSIGVTHQGIASNVFFGDQQRLRSTNRFGWASGSAVLTTIDAELTRISPGFVGLGSPTNKVSVGHNGTSGTINTATGNLVLSAASGPSLTVRTDNTFDIGANGTHTAGQRMALGSGGLNLVSGSSLTFASSSTQYFTGVDLRIRRSSANTLDLDTGTDGAFADLRLRNLTASGEINTGGNYYSIRTLRFGAPNDAQPCMYVRSATASGTGYFANGTVACLTLRSNSQCATTPSNADIQIGNANDIAGGPPRLVLNQNKIANYTAVLNANTTVEGGLTAASTSGRSVTLGVDDANSNVRLQSNSTSFGISLDGSFTGGGASHSFRFGGNPAFIIGPSGAGFFIGNSASVTVNATGARGITLGVDGSNGTLTSDVNCFGIALNGVFTGSGAAHRFQFGGATVVSVSAAGQVCASAGTTLAPGFAFLSAPNAGLTFEAAEYLNSPSRNGLSFATAGGSGGGMSNDSEWRFGNASRGWGVFFGNLTNGSTSDANDVSRLVQRSRTTATVLRNAGELRSGWVDWTDASRLGRLTLHAYNVASTQEGFRIEANPGGVRLSFNGVTAVARPTLPDAGTVTAADIRTALISLGLCQ